jgi:ATP-dependent Clp protease adaptor protein ClpS
MSRSTVREIRNESISEGDVLTVPKIDEPGSGSNEYRVILYNDDWHAFEDVIEQVVKACECSLAEAERITVEAHRKGRAVCYRGSREKCHKAARVLREIRLQCEVDCD